MSGAQLSMRIDPLSDAVAWADQHPDQLEYVLEIARRDIRNGIHPSADYCWHCLRRSGLVTRQAGEPVTCNDHATSSLARYLKREHGVPFRTRDAAVDRWA